MKKTLACLALAAACLTAGSPARAERLTEAEIERLQAGATVVRPQVVEEEGARYVGGVSYAIVSASLDELASVFDDVAAYRELLPRTKRARLVGENDGARYVELLQGNSMLTTSYTIRLRHDRAGHVVRFRLDPTHPHPALRDAWGFFRYEVLPGDPNKVLLTYGVLADLGQGVLRDMFEDRVRAVMLTVPELVQRYVVHHVRRPPTAKL